MTMTAKGLAKLIEECGELIQVAGKKLAYFHTDMHPDGAGSLKERLGDEMADVSAAIIFVAQQLDLDVDRIELRADKKLKLYETWEMDPDNDAHSINQGLVKP